MLFTLNTFAQKEYIVQEYKGEQLMLYTEEEGKLNLFTERSTRDYRFFLKKGDDLVEITKDNYREKIDEFTSDVDLNTRSLNFTRKDLSRVVLKYNYGGEDSMGSLSGVRVRLGAWGGVSNFTSFNSDEDENIGFAGLEFEFYSETDYSRNSIIAQFRRSFPNDDFDLDVSEFMLGYRFKAIDTKYFHFYLEAELITFGRYRESFTELNNDDLPVLVNQTSTSLSTPVGLGAGMAIKLFQETYLTLGYSNLVKLGESTRSDFPVDVRFGIKFRL